jgi:hypothetical protein
VRLCLVVMRSTPIAGLLGIGILLAPAAAAHAEFRIRTLHRSAPSYYCAWQEGGKGGSCRFTSPAKTGSSCDCVEAGGKTVHHGIVCRLR